MKTKNRRRRNRQTAYWVYAKPNQMQGHKFTDDVALCKATSLLEAYKKFSKLYGDCTPVDVFRLDSRNAWGDGVLILTDY